MKTQGICIAVLSLLLLDGCAYSEVGRACICASVSVSKDTSAEVIEVECDENLIPPR